MIDWNANSFYFILRLPKLIKKISANVWNWVGLTLSFLADINNGVWTALSGRIDYGLIPVKEL